MLLRKLWITAALSATGYVGDSPLFLLDYLLRFLRVVVLLSVWRSIFTARPEVAGLLPGAVLTYTLVSEVFAELLSARTRLTDALWDGSIAVRYLQPLGMVAHFGAEMVGRLAFGLVLFSLPLLLFAPALGVDPRPASFVSGLLFPLSLALAVCVGLALEFIAGAVMVATAHNIWAFNRIRFALTALLSGALLPLAVLPWGMGRVLEWLPFAGMASAPLRIYTGTGEPLRLMALQGAWALMLWPLSGAVWRRYRDRLVSHGG